MGILYLGGTGKMYRDFSENSKQKLLSLVSEVENEKLCDFTDWIGDRWYDFEAWIGMLNIRNYLSNVNLYHKKVIDKNNTTKATIESIFKEVERVDNRYRNTCFSFRKAQLCKLNLYIETLNEIVNPANGKFTAEYVSSMRDVLEECINQLNCKPTTEEPYPTLMGFDFTSLVLGSRETWKDALVIGWTSDWIKNITSLFHIGDSASEIAVRKSIESVIAQMLKNKHEVADFYEKYIETLKPEETEIAKKIINYFIKTGKACAKDELAQLLKIDVREFENSDFLKWLLQNENLEFVNDISDKISDTIGAFGDAVDMLDISTKFLTKFYGDYSEDVKYIEAIRSALLDGGYDNKTVNETVDSMLWEYRNQYESAIHDLVEMVAEKGINEVMDMTIGKALPGVGLFLDAKDITSSLIGLDDMADTIAQIYATQQYSYGLVEKYDFYRQKIKSGNYTSNDVEQCDMYFGLAKAAKLQEYKAIKATIESALNNAGASVFSSAEDKQYTRDMLVKLDAEIIRLENLSI